MKSAWLGLLPIAAFSLGTLGACGGVSDSPDTSHAGSGGSAQGGDTAGSTAQGGSSAGTGTTNGGSASMTGGASNGGEPSVEECNPAECGPRLGLPNWMCENGMVGGPTGRCIRQGSGTCGWEINHCQPAGAGGAAGQGGASNEAGGPTGGAPPDECGGCDTNAQQICIYQTGGPGPSHYTCATQNPCGNALACACIVGQGSCQFSAMGGMAGYCVCSNGLK